MKMILRAACGLALIFTVAPACLQFTGTMEPGTVKTLLLIGAGLWFVAATPLAGMHDGERPK